VRGAPKPAGLSGGVGRGCHWGARRPKLRPAPMDGGRVAQPGLPPGATTPRRTASRRRDRAPPWHPGGRRSPSAGRLGGRAGGLCLSPAGRVGRPGLLGRAVLLRPAAAPRRRRLRLATASRSGSQPRAAAPGGPGSQPRAAAPGGPGSQPRAAAPGGPGSQPRAAAPGGPGSQPRAAAPGGPGGCRPLRGEAAQVADRDLRPGLSGAAIHPLCPARRCGSRPQVRVPCGRPRSGAQPPVGPDWIPDIRRRCGRPPRRAGGRCGPDRPARRAGGRCGPDRRDRAPRPLGHGGGPAGPVLLVAAWSPVANHRGGPPEGGRAGGPTAGPKARPAGLVFPGRPLRRQGNPGRRA
jgi:hypothetical protein